MTPDKRSAWLQKLDEECPYQVVLPRRQLADDSAIMDFLLKYAGIFDMYVEDEWAAYVRYCFQDPMDAENGGRPEPKTASLTVGYAESLLHLPNAHAPREQFGCLLKDRRLQIAHEPPHGSQRGSPALQHR